MKRREDDLRRQDLRIGVLDAIVAGMFTKKGSRRPKPSDFYLSGPRTSPVATTPEQQEQLIIAQRALTGGYPIPDWALSPEERAKRKAERDAGDAHLQGLQPLPSVGP